MVSVELEHEHDGSRVRVVVGDGRHMFVEFVSAAGSPRRFELSTTMATLLRDALCRRYGLPEVFDATT